MLLARVISARGDCHEIIRESLDAVGANGVRPNHHGHASPFEESVQVIGTEQSNVVLLLGISDIVVLEAIVTFVLMGV